MPQLPRALVKARAERLRAAGEEALRRHLDSRTGVTVHGLVEREGLARAEDFTEVAFESDLGGLAQPGQIVPLTVTGHDGRKAFARLAHSPS
jgi:threonylcarbamoyladenosine tRNA methylthiotransferase MtaB